MKNFKALALSTVAIIGLSVSASHADAGANFTSHYSVDEKPYEAYVERLPSEEKLEIREYLNYEEREPCQFYQPIPQGFVKDGCDIVRVAPVQQVEVQQRTIQREVLADYDINFPFDSANIEPAADSTLNRVASEIKTHKPSEITVAGHTDTSGPSEYNAELSQRRAEAVSQALTDRGITNRILDKRAYGENNLEVPTGDGVRNAENRRVEIQFLK